MEALRLAEILIPIGIRGIYQVVVEALTVTLAEQSKRDAKKTRQGRIKAALGDDEQAGVQSAKESCSE